MDFIQGIKDYINKELQLFPVEVLSKGNTVQIMVNKSSIYLIKKTKLNTLKINAYTGSKPAFTMVVLNACIKQNMPVEIGTDFDFSEDNQLVPITYMELPDPSQLN